MKSIVFKTSFIVIIFVVFLATIDAMTSTKSQPIITDGIGVFKSPNDRMIFSRADLINNAFGLSRY